MQPQDPFADLAAPKQDPFGDLKPEGFMDFQRQALSEDKPADAYAAQGSALKGAYRWWASGLHEKAEDWRSIQAEAGKGNYQPLNEWASEQAMGLVTGPVGKAGIIGRGLNKALSFGVPAETKAFSAGLANDLFHMNNQTRAERTLLRQYLDKVPAVPQSTWEKLYHYDEARAYTPNKLPEVTPYEAELFNKYIVPLKAAIKKLRGKVYDLPESELHEEGVPRQVKNKGSTIDRIIDRASYALPWRRSLPKSATTLHRRSMMVVEDQTGRRQLVHLGEGEIIAPTSNGPQLVARYKRIPKEGSYMVSKDGRVLTLRQATTKEIEANTRLQYHKNPLVNYIATFAELSQAARHREFLDKLTKTPEWANHAVPVSGHNIPKGWYTPDVPQFRGWAVEPHVAHVLDDFAQTFLKHGDAEGFLARANRFLTATIFFNPLPHIFNVGDHWIVERGLSGWTLPQNYVRLLRTGRRAIQAIRFQNQDFIDALRSGGSMMFADRANKNFYDLLLKQMGADITRNEHVWAPIAKMFGYANPISMVKAIYEKSANGLWMANDMFILQRAYEIQEIHPGTSLKEALAEAEKHIPNYRIPAEVMGSRAVATLLKNPNYTMFGPYHYGVFKSYSEMVKSMVKPLAAHERQDAIDKMLMLGFMAIFFYPTMDSVAKTLTGNPNASFRRFGASAFPYNMYLVSQGQRNLSTELATLVTPAPATIAAFELLSNRDLFTGKNVYQEGDASRAMHGNLTSAAHIGYDVSSDVLGKIAPIGLMQGSPLMEGKKSWQQIVEGMFGIVDPSAAQIAAQQISKAFKERNRLKRDAQR